MKSDDMSQASGMPAVWGNVFHCVPKIVLFEQKWTYAASALTLISSGRGNLQNFSLSVVAITRAASPATILASLYAFLAHWPVMM